MATCLWKRKSAGAATVGETASGDDGQRVHAGRQQFLKAEGGFTLIEVVVSMALMTVGLFAVMQMQVVALNQSTIAYRLTTASALAESALEDVMSWSSSDPRMSVTGAVSTGFSFGDSPFAISNVSYTVTYTLTQNTPISGMTLVVVNVKGGGRNITVQGYKEVT